MFLFKKKVAMLNSSVFMEREILWADIYTQVLENSEKAKMGIEKNGAETHGFLKQLT